MNIQQQPIDADPKHQPNGMNSGHQPNGVNPGHQPNGVNPGHQPNGVNPQRRQNGIVPNIRYTPYGPNPQRQPNIAIPLTYPTPDEIESERQQNGIGDNARHTPNGRSSQPQRGEPNLERQQSQSTPQGQALMPPQPTLMGNDYPVTAIRVPASTDERPRHVGLEIRDCGCRPGCRCRYPDLRRFLGEHETWDIDYQMFRAVWEPPGMESLHGAYMLFTLKTLTRDDRSHAPWNPHFLARLKGDVFIMKYKESLDERAALTARLGYPTRIVPHGSGLTNVRYEHIDLLFLGSKLFEEMTLAATHPYSRVCTQGLTDLALPLGFWRAFVAGRIRTADDRMPPVPSGIDLIMERYSLLHQRGSPMP